MSKSEMNLFISPSSRATEIIRYIGQSIDITGVSFGQLNGPSEPVVPEAKLVRGIADDGANDLHRLHIPMEVTWDPIP